MNRKRRGALIEQSLLYILYMTVTHYSLHSLKGKWIQNLNVWLSRISLDISSRGKWIDWINCSMLYTQHNNPHYLISHAHPRREQQPPKRPKLEGCFKSWLLTRIEPYGKRNLSYDDIGWLGKGSEWRLGWVTPKDLSSPIFSSQWKCLRTWSRLSEIW